MTPEDQERLARSRFMMLNAIRAGGVAVMLIGMLIVATGIIQPKEIVGGVIFAIGFFDAMILPAFLTRKWRTPPGQ